MLEIKNGAIFVADVHCMPEDSSFYEFLDAILCEKIKCNQLILLGDIFALLIGKIPKSIQDNKKVIDKINELANKIELIYFAGNHDFYLDNIFTNVKIYKREVVFARHNNKILCLAHGDIFLPKFTQFALNLLQNNFILTFLCLLNTLCFNLIYKKICNRQKVKILYKKLENFKEIVSKRMQSYKAFLEKNDLKIDMIIEGHFHQGKSYKFDNVDYFNLDAFANDRSFFILEYTELKKQCFKK